MKIVTQNKKKSMNKSMHTNKNVKNKKKSIIRVCIRIRMLRILSRE